MNATLCQPAPTIRLLSFTPPRSVNVLYVDDAVAELVLRKQSSLIEDKVFVLAENADPIPLTRFWGLND